MNRGCRPTRVGIDAASQTSSGTINRLRTDSTIDTGWLYRGADGRGEVEADLAGVGRRGDDAARS